MPGGVGEHPERIRFLPREGVRGAEQPGIGVGRRARGRRIRARPAPVDHVVRRLRALEEVVAPGDEIDRVVEQRRVELGLAVEHLGFDVVAPVLHAEQLVVADPFVIELGHAGDGAHRHVVGQRELGGEVGLPVLVVVELDAGVVVVRVEVVEQAQVGRAERVARDDARIVVGRERRLARRLERIVDPVAEVALDDALEWTTLASRMSNSRNTSGVPSALESL